MFSLYDNPSVKDIISANEGQCFDRKSSRINWTAFADTLIGFANADGGVIAVGLDSDKSISGIQDWEVATSDIRKQATTQVSPPIPVQIKPLHCKNLKNADSKILLVEIPPSLDVHHNAKDEVYLRIGDKNIKLNSEQRTFLIDGKGKNSFESEVAPGATLFDIDETVITEYRDALKQPDISTEDLLLGRDLAVKKENTLFINLAGILLFGQKPERWVERSRVRILRFEGTKEESGKDINITKDIMITGPLPLLIRKSQDTLQSLLREYTTIDMNGKFISEAEYPLLACQEVIVNAVVHRSYALRGADIQIKMYDDHLEVISPGQFPGPVNETNIKDTHYSRNPRIARVITELGFVRELGEGVNRVFKVFKDSNLPDPSFSEKAQAEVLVTFKNNSKSRKVRKDKQLVIASLDPEVLRSLSEKEKKIILFVTEYGQITTKECGKLINQHKSSALRELKQLTARDLLKQNDSGTNNSNYTLGIKFVKEQITSSKLKYNPEQKTLF